MAGFGDRPSDVPFLRRCDRGAVAVGRALEDESQFRLACDDAVGGQFYTLREKLLGGAGYSACSKRPHGDSATPLTTLPPGQQLPPGMIATVRESPAELGRPEEGQPPAEQEVVVAAETLV